MNPGYSALVVRKVAGGGFQPAIETLSISDLPAQDVLVRVQFSTVNYKDLLSCQGNPAVTRRFPHVPGIDAMGVVEASADPRWPVGTAVAVIAQPMGLNSPGGWAQFIRVPGDWLMPVPDGFAGCELMSLGTAGLTAALAVEALCARLAGPAELVVSGAGGGIGCLGAAILAQMGHRVTAVTDAAPMAEHLQAGGVAEVLARAAVLDHSGRNLLSPRWDAALDVAGGTMLSTLLRSLRPGGVVAVTGNAGETGLDVNVLPFILRGVRLDGINAEAAPAAARQRLWSRLADAWRPTRLAELYRVVPLAELPALIPALVRREIPGRVVIDLADAAEDG